ncbi:MAG TPA: serine/threonine-protein kinase [Actinomycetota bacterium]|nr:serine/threonine-protein kinase [Actinomycetota bacterium]
MTAPADPRLGTRLAGYQIQSLLGRGGMGVVYLAEQERPHRQVALKLLLDPATTSEAFQERFLRESELAAAIDHPNVLPVYDASETDGVLWIAMRYVPGIDLAALLARDGALAPEQALAIVGPVAGGLDAAHTRGLVHRDVKPANILLAMEQDAVTHAYLADFGLTKRIGGARGLTVSGQVLGTIDYIAPEQIEGGPVDGRADQYSLGCVLFECLTGVVPFQRDSELAVLWAHVHDPPPQVSEHRPDLAAGLDKVVDRALAKAPGERYPSCQALVATAQAALAGTAPARPRRRRRRLTRRSSLALAVTAGLLSAGLLAAAVLLARDGGAPPDATTPAVLAAADRAVRIDPGSFEAQAAVAVGTDPAAVVAGDGLVWVANRRDGTVTVIDPGTNRVQETIPASGSWPVGQGGPGLALADGSLWVADADQERVARVEPGADPIPIPVDARPSALAAAPDADTVWMTAQTRSGRGLLARIDVRTNRVDLKIPLPQVPSGLALTADGGTVWTVTRDRTLRSFDTRTGDRGEPVKLGLAPDQVAVGDGAVWVTSFSRDTVLRVDPAKPKAEEIRVGDGPTGIAFGADRVWVANGLDGTMSAIDPQTGDVATRRLGFRPAAVAVVAEQRAVWVALAA